MAKKKAKPSKQVARRSSQHERQGSARRGAKRSARSRSRTSRRSYKMLFAKRNYMLLILGVALVTIGYVMMRMENEVEGIISLYIAPIIITGGYLEILYAILWREKPKENAEA